MLAGTPASGREFLSIGTGGTGGVFFPLGAAMSKILTDNMPGYDFTAEATGASVENIRLLARDEIQLAMVFANIAYDAAVGQGSFSNPLPIRALFNMYPTPIHIVTPAGSGIYSIADFRGRRIGVGSPGSGNEVISRLLLSVYGLTYDDIRPEFLSIAEIMNGIRDGVVDAGISATSFPTASIIDLCFTNPMRMIPIEEEKMAIINAENPFFTPSIIPHGIYAGIDQDTPTVAHGNYMLVLESMDEELAYNITRLLYENRAGLEAAHSVAQQMTLEEGINVSGVEFHPGALRFWREKGLLQ